LEHIRGRGLKTDVTAGATPRVLLDYAGMENRAGGFSTANRCAAVSLTAVWTSVNAVVAFC